MVKTLSFQVTLLSGCNTKLPKFVAFAMFQRWVWSMVATRVFFGRIFIVGVSLRAHVMANNGSFMLSWWQGVRSFVLGQCLIVHPKNHLVQIRDNGFTTFVKLYLNTCTKFINSWAHTIFKAPFPKLWKTHHVATMTITRSDIDLNFSSPLLGRTPSFQLGASLLLAYPLVTYIFKLGLGHSFWHQPTPLL